MALPPFRLPSTEFSSSIVMDASTVENTTVTVAVSAARADEPDILNSVYEFGENLNFKPFYDKANDFEYEERREFSEDIIREHQHQIAAYSHDSELNDNADTQQIEAVHSAIHVNNLLQGNENPLVIVDGDDQKAKPFVRALSGLRPDPPTVTHCLQSEYYYPTALLADLASNYLAHSIEKGEFNWGNPIIPAPPAKTTMSDSWGPAFSAMYGNELEYEPAELNNRRGETVRQRICCWHEGAVAMDAGSDPPMSSSLNPVVQALRREGYDELAAMIDQI